MLGIDAIHAACEYDVHTHQAATDTPVCARLEQLLKRYPNALFILPTLFLAAFENANTVNAVRSFTDQ